MGSFLQKLLTNPEDFKFYAGNQKGAVSPNNQNPRTIPFGRDRVGGKDSNQPYIKKGLLNISGKDSSFYNDFTIRGGILAPLHAAEDVLRLTKFFADIKNPKGLLFLAKENILSRIGTKTEASKGIGYAGGGLNEGVYTPLSTIGQALVGFAGGHLNKQGLDPTGLFASANINKYQDIIAENQINRGDNFDFSDNRLTSLYTYIITSSFAPGNSFNGVKGYSLTPSSNILIEYGGGPGSVLGIGKTKIRFATKNDGANKLTVFNNKKDINSFVKNAFSPLTIDGTSPLAINLNRLVNLSKKEPITGDISYFPKSTFGKKQYDSDILLEYKGGPGSNDKVDGTTKIKYATDNSGFKSTVFNANVYNINSFVTNSLELPQRNINSNRLFRLTNEPPTSNILFKYKGGPGSKGEVNRSTEIKYATSNQGLKSTVFDADVYKINSFETGSGLTKKSINSNRLFSLANSPNWYLHLDPLFEYFGGPGSGGDINKKTKINYATDNEGLKLTVFDIDNSFNLLNAEGSRYATFNYSTISSQSLNLDGNTKKDFRSEPPLLNSGIIPKGATSFLSKSPNYIDKNIEDNLNLGNPGRRDRNRSSYTSGSNRGEALDKVNASSIYKSKTFIEGESINISQEGEYKDIIPFIISILNNENQPEGPYKKNMHFRAFIDSFSDSYDADWSSIDYMGRAEKLYKYKGFGRKISMAFTVVAQSREEILKMYEKLNFLASSLAPEYLPSGYMAGNIAYITLGEYIYNQPGIINSLTFDIPEESPWEIGIGDDGERIYSTYQVPHMIKVTGFNFTPIHTFKPEKQSWEDDPEDKNKTNLILKGKQIYIARNSRSWNIKQDEKDFSKEDLSLTIPTTQQDILVT